MVVEDIANTYLFKMFNNFIYDNLKLNHHRTLKSKYVHRCRRSMQ